ncbi:uncharacterized protein LOC108903172 [Anoplophora glabripennis]|uniref:uncharacterized protein LOC108903172 n=1 Tax=Anoplophora glabripennis TaxID=217634 RepID=UPI000874B74B|nr:uncharacterized protein LOC108903172 [Anoplophora glabripennis]
MPVLLLRELSSTSLSALVEKAQKKSPPLPEYDLQLNNGHLDLILLTKPDRKINSTSTDEGFESDIDSLSIVSSDNDSFTIEKHSESASKTTETDSANGSSSSDSDTEVAETKSSETNRSNSENPKQDQQSNEDYSLEKTVEHFNLVDCICYTDVKCTDILIFVIKREAFVFKFDNITNLQNFYTNFTTLKAVANQKAYNKNFTSKFNLLQRTDQNGVTHIEITREADPRLAKDEGPSSIISINTPEDIFQKFSKNFDKIKDVNSRQRAESKYINDIKYNTINSKLGPKAKIITKSNSIENILDLDQYKSNLVNTNKDNNLKKIWNSAENLLEPPKRPERRKKLKGKAPQPPKMIEEKQDVLSGQYVRVNVNFDTAKDLDKNRLIIKSSLNEPHPKKLQNFNILSTKPSLASFLKPKEKQVVKYEPKKIDTGTLLKYRLPDSSWTNSVPRMLKKPRSKSETRNFVPMAYRYIDTTQDYPVSYNVNSQRNYDKLSYTSNHFQQNMHTSYGQNLAMSNYLRGENNSQNINNRLFGLSPKLREFANSEDFKNDSRWGSANEISVTMNKDNNLKSVIKNNRDDASKKKNEKKVTFSAYTTVQVV